MNNLWDNIKKGLQHGAASAAARAEEMARLGRARLDIAAAKSQIQRARAELGAAVHELLEAGAGKDLGSDLRVLELHEQLARCEEELEARRAAFALLREEVEQARQRTDAFDPLEDATPPPRPEERA